MFIVARGRIELPTPVFQMWAKVMLMNTFFVLGGVALLSLLAFYWKGKISTSFMTTGVLVILFIFSFLTGR
jgi:hypothetical protein